jgi:hypothetical protein
MIIGEGHIHVFMDEDRSDWETLTAETVYPVAAGVKPSLHTLTFQLYNHNHTPVDPETTYSVDIPVKKGD